MAPGNHIQVVGQIDSMNTAFQNMSLGLVFAAIFVYLLMVVNYQTWADPFVVILALPATLCGAVTMLFVTGTTLSVPSLMGMIMAVGVASANSILLVTYARDEQLAGKTGAPSRGGGRRHPNSAGADDSDGDDRRHAADGDRRAGRRAERRFGARGRGRPAFCYPYHFAARALSLCDAAQRRRRQSRTWRIRGRTGMMATRNDTRPVELLRPSEPEPAREPEREVEHGRRLAARAASSWGSAR